jgi:hypothetical protein
MRFSHIKRILMQAVDANGAGGGTGAPPAQPSTPPAAAPAPAAPPTPPAAPAPGAPPAATLAPELARAVENSVNAALRRAGVLGQNGTPPQAAAAAALAPATPAQPQPDISQLRALDRALTATGRAAALDETAYRRLERDFVAEQPPDARTWVDSYFRGFGIVQMAGTPAPAAAPTPPSAPAPNTPPATQPPPAAAAPAGTQQPQPNGQPASNAGGPPAPQQHLEDIDLIGASEADRKHLLQTKGLKWYTDTYERQLRDRRVKVR